MRNIQIDDEVFSALRERIQDFEETPNDVIKRLLEGTSTAKAIQASVRKTDAAKGSDDSLVQLVTSPRYEMGDGKERYFAVLRFLFQKNAEQFGQLEGFRRGSRVNISKDEGKIERSGTSTNPQKLEGTPYYVMTNLDNRRKREILEDVLRILKYPAEVIKVVVGSIPDSGISRPKRNFYNEYVNR